MESLLEPVELNRETTQALDEIRSGAENALYGVSSADAEEKVNRYVLPLIEGSGLPNLHVMHYRWYLRELARHWRTRQGRDLAFHLELCIRKWVNLGLEPRTLQFLICESHERLKGQDSTTKAPSHQEPAMPAKTGTVPHAECSEGLSPAFAQETPSASSAVDSPSPESGQSAESAKSADVRGPEPESATKTRNHEEEETTAKDAKTAKSEDSITRSLDPSVPSASTTKTPSHQGSEHSIPRSLDPSIPEELS